MTPRRGLARVVRGGGVNAINSRRAVALTQKGVKGDLRRRFASLGRRGVQGAPRPAISFSRRNERPAYWGDDPPRPAWRNAVSIALLIVAFWGSLVLAAWVGAGWGR